MRCCVEKNHFVLRMLCFFFVLFFFWHLTLTLVAQKAGIFVLKANKSSWLEREKLETLSGEVIASLKKELHCLLAHVSMDADKGVGVSVLILSSLK